MAHGSGTTTNGLRYPTGTDPVDLNQFFQDLAEDVDTFVNGRTGVTYSKQFLMMGAS